jgi:hypothetical protein
MSVSLAVHYFPKQRSSFIEIVTIFDPVHVFFVPFCVLANSLHTRLSMGTSGRLCNYR